MRLKNKLSSKYIEYFLYLLPLCFVLGTAVLNFVSYLLSLFSLYFIFKKKIFIKKKYIIFILVLFGLLILNVLFSEDLLLSIKRLANVFKFFLIGLLIFYLIDNNSNLINKFSKYLFILLIIISIDVLIQFHFGQDIFGFEKKIGHGVRLSGPFGDEYVVGSFIAKFAFVSSIFLFMNNKIFIGIFYLFFLLLITFLSNERAASIMFFITFIVFLIFNKYIELKLKLILAFVISLLVYLFVIFTPLKTHFFDRTFEQVGISKNNYKVYKSFWNSQFGAHYLTAYEIFKDNTFFGSGMNTFKVICYNDKYNSIKSTAVKARCATHPHNIYFEVLSDFGLSGFILLIMFNIWLFYNYIVLLLFSKKNYDKIYILYFVTYLLLFNPFQTTGSLMSSWNGGIYWLLTAFLIKNICDRKNIKK